MKYVVQLVRSNSPVHVRRRDLLGYRDFRRAISAQFCSQSSDALTTYTLAEVLLFAAPGRASTTSLVSTLAMSALPLLIVGPIAGRVSDHAPRKQILVRGHILRMIATFIALVSLVDKGRFIGFGVFGMLILITRVLYTARATSIPRLVRRHELVAADSTSLILSVVAGGVGALAGGLLSHVLLGLGFAIAAIGQGLAALLYRSINVDLGGGGAAHRNDSRVFIRDLLAPRMRFAVLATTSHRLLLGLCLAAMAVTIDARVGLSTAGSVLVLGCAGAGAFAGSFCAEWATEHFPRRMIASGSFLLTGIFIFVGGLAPYDFAPLGSLVFASFLFQILRVRSDASIQANANPLVLGRIFATYDIVYNMAFITGGLTGVVLITRISLIPLACIVAAIYVVLSGLLLTIEDGKSGNESPHSSSRATHPTSSRILLPQLTN